MRTHVTAAVVLSLALAALAAPPSAHAQPAGPELNRIVDQGMAHSEVLRIAAYLTDVIGGRLTNSPQMRVAEAWTIDLFRRWGLRNVRKDGFAFGRGWSYSAVSARMLTPRVVPLTAIPVAWTPATPGVISAPIVVAPMRRERDLAGWHGKLSGKIVLVTLPNDGDEPREPAFRRLTGEDLAKADQFRQPDFRPEAVERMLDRIAFAGRLDAFLREEGALAWVRMAYRDGKLVHGEGYGFSAGATPTVPAIELAAEDYRRLARLAKVGPAPTLELSTVVAYDDTDANAYNILAELPGTDPGAGYVMAGAHLDSWVAGDGAADNGAGTAVVMEAARILAAVGVRPRRTIRFALWAGEEQGLLGSQAYADKYLASRPPLTGPGRPGLPPGIEARVRWPQRFPITAKPGLPQLTAYFNIDNGSGMIRGIHAEGNLAAVPVLRDWLAPFAGLGATAVVASPTGGTDHVFLQALGVPAYQFVQDPLDYDARVHHSSVDTFDHLRADDLRQAAVVLAGVLAAAADSTRTLPRMPTPTSAPPTNPFRYDDPDGP